MRIAIALTLVATVLVGCSDGGEGQPQQSGQKTWASCSFAQDGSTLSCAEFEVDPGTLASARQQCTNMGKLMATFAEAKCSRTGAVTGCRRVQSGTETVVWVYAGSAASFDGSCRDTGGQPVAP